ncbi:MAG: RNA methyltransferase [Arcobacter sp.]|nr:MAG: RNA methyltransferase [Arcobacter sp.]
MFNIVLHEPRMPGNVGTIGRTAFALDCTLHLIKPYGFGEITAKEVRRAGLDYWFDLDVREYENIEEFWEKNPFSSRHFFATTKTKKNYFEAKFEEGDYIYFGREDAGLPQSILDKNKETCITIPMANNARSLNLSNSVSIIAYEALKQNYSSFKQS